eukprot:1152873-Amphidinium_carterae.1
MASSVQTELAPSSKGPMHTVQHAYRHFWVPFKHHKACKPFDAGLAVLTKSNPLRHHSRTHAFANRSSPHDTLQTHKTTQHCSANAKAK